jgi:serine/threonine protein kinase
MNCDIKSENVMISKDGATVKVIDFGHLISEEEYPIVGTRSYQPPELWLEDSYSYKSMVWSIGITALEFLYRVHPVVDMIYGTEESESDSSSIKKSDSGDTKGDDAEYSVEDEFRERYTHLFQILQEEKQKTLPFRHRISSVDKKHRDKLSSINFVLDRMLTYDVKKRISLEELYHCRIFDNIRAGVKEERILTHSRDNLFLNKELTPLFLSLGRKLYRDEVMVQAYTILTMFIEKKPSIVRDRQEFLLTSLACLDIMSYVFSMVPSSRNLHRKIILKMKSITEFQVFDRVIEVLKAVEFKVFQRTPVLHIKQQEQAVLFPLLLELIESEAESGKKKLMIHNLIEKYSSDNYSSDKEDSDSDDDEKDSDEDGDEKEESDSEEDIDEADIDFIQDFRKRIETVYKQDRIKRNEEEDSIEIQIL